MKNGGSFHCYVSSPEGRFCYQNRHSSDQCWFRRSKHEVPCYQELAPFSGAQGTTFRNAVFLKKNSSHIGVSIDSRVAFACLCNQTSQWKVHEPLHFSTCTHDFIIFPIPEGKSILRISWHRGTILWLAPWQIHEFGNSASDAWHVQETERYQDPKRRGSPKSTSAEQPSIFWTLDNPVTLGYLGMHAMKRCR